MMDKDDLAGENFSSQCKHYSFQCRLLYTRWTSFVVITLEIGIRQKYTILKTPELFKYILPSALSFSPYCNSWNISCLYDFNKRLMILLNFKLLIKINNNYF